MASPTKQKPLRWRRVYFRVFFRREYRYELRRGDCVVAHVKHSNAGWYWIAEGSGMPTFAGSPDECKAQARAAVVALEAARRAEGK